MTSSSTKAAENAILRVLRNSGEALGAEEIIPACAKYGVTWENGSNTGPLFKSMSSRGLIEHAGFYKRSVGSPGICWRATSATKAV